MLSVLGGLCGIALGSGAAYLLSRLRGGMPVEVSGAWIALACGISTIIGVGFGYYPARKAARLDPIDALRYE